MQFTVKVMHLHSDCSEPELCVVVTSASNEVADTWTFAKMSHKLTCIRDLRSQYAGICGKAPTVKMVIDNSFYEPPDHQLIGVGF